MKYGVEWCSVVSSGYLWGIVGAERAAMPHIKYRYKGTFFSEYASFYQKNSIKNLMYSTAGKCQPLRRKTKHKQTSSTAGSYYIPTFLHKKKSRSYHQPKT